MSDTDIALSLKQQLNLCVSTLIGMGHTVCTEDGIVVEINENKRAASLVANISDGVTTSSTGAARRLRHRPHRNLHPPRQARRSVAIYKAP